MKVEELISESDGKVCAAVVKTTSKDSRPVYLRRVAQHLIPIEVKVVNEDAHSTQPAVIQPVNPSVQGNTGRP